MYPHMFYYWTGGQAYFTFILNQEQFYINWVPLSNSAVV